MIKHKTIVCVILFSFFCNILFAVEFHRAGETYTFKKDMQCFDAKEAGETLRRLKEAEVQKDRIVILEKLVADYEKQAEMFRASIAAHEGATKEYQMSIEALRNSTQEYKNAASIYKDVIAVQAEALKMQTQQANNNRKMRRWEKNLAFFIGFVAPVAGAWSVGRIGNIIK